MARVVETDEPVVVREDNNVPQHVHDEPRRSNTGVILLLILLVLILLGLFYWRPWSAAGSSGAGGTYNINVHTSPNTTPSKP